MKRLQLRFFNGLFFSALFFVLTGVMYADTSDLSVIDAAEKMDAAVSWDPFSQKIVFSALNHTIYCRVGQPLIFFDNTDIQIAEEPFLKNGQPMIPHTLFNKINSFLVNHQPKEPLFLVGVILIDPGHGGKDPGAVGSYIENGKTVPVHEKEVALAVSLKLYQQLKETYPDKKILLTRSDDSFPSLEERVNMANNVKLKKNEAMLYISIHANASLSKRSAGFEVWYLPQSYRRTLVDKNSTSKELAPILNSMLEEEFTMESILIAKNVLEGLDAQIGKQSKKRGLREKEWFVVRNAKMPSVLIELGFVTNPVEAKLLSTPAYLQKCAMGIYNGLVSFITLFER